MDEARGASVEQRRTQERVRSLARRSPTEWTAWFGLALSVACALSAAPAFGAGATPSAPGSPMGVVPTQTKAGVAKRRLAPLEASNNLTYHNGPVMHRVTAYAIYWEPAGYSTPTDYKDRINQYFRDLEQDSGRDTNVFGLTAQYRDTSSSNVFNAFTYGGPIVDTHPYPGNGCSAPSATACLTPSQLSDEVSSIISSRGLSRGLSAMYFVMTPPSVGGCANGTGCTLTQNGFCAWHAWDGSPSDPVILAFHPYPVNGSCNPGGRSDADAQINLLSHEHAEALTDPVGDGWYSLLPMAGEIGDLCAWDFGQATGSDWSGFGFDYNQTINGDHYYLQREWSNTDGSCQQTVTWIPRAQFDVTRSPVLTNHKVTFDGSASSSTVPITDYTYSVAPEPNTNPSGEVEIIGGAGSPAPRQTYTFSEPGNYTVSLSVTDASGRTSTSFDQRYTVLPDAAPFPRFRIAEVASAAGGLFRFRAADSFEIDGDAINAYDWRFSDGSTAHGVDVRHRFKPLGSNSATLTVTDSTGRTSAPLRQSVIGTRGRPVTTVEDFQVDSKRHTGKFVFAVFGWVDRYDCALTRSSAAAGAKKMTFRRCSSPKSYRKLGRGKYRFAVRGFNKFGSTTDSYAFRIR